MCDECTILREHYQREQLRAHAILDRARAGLLVSSVQIRWALLTLGEPVNAA